MPIVVAKSDGRSVTFDLGGLVLHLEVGWEDGGLSSGEEGGSCSTNPVTIMFGSLLAFSSISSRRSLIFFCASKAVGLLTLASLRKICSFFFFFLLCLELG